jgi:uncharacterized repeat protein (TIGR03803 family)
MKHKSMSGGCAYLLMFALTIGLAVVTTPRTQAQTMSPLYGFTGYGDGGTPLSGLTRDKKGNLYGTTSNGSSGYGTLFELEPSSSGWTLDTLHSFTSGTDGANPTARLRFGPHKVLYGTTSAGGSGSGTVFQLDSAGETVLYSFVGGSDGSQPSPGDLVFDHVGNIYGTTSYGGSSGNGTVFKLVRQKNSAWKEKLLYSFGQGTDGTVPLGGVIFDGQNTLYGTTSTGGSYGYGTVYQLKHSGAAWTETILYNFQDGDDGGTPYAGVIRGKSGKLYGATVSGGSGQGGTVFELTPANGGWTFTVLYSIPGWSVSGTFRDLFLSAAGNLYGTTHCDGPDESGTVFELTPSNGTWAETWEYDFQGGTGGNFLFSNLVLDSQGNVYGTTSDGGPNYEGMVFEITP